jgi:type II secretion system protein J
MMQNLPLESERGLTLIEVLIAMALLAFISIAIYQATVSSFNINFKLGNESADYTAIALTLQTVESDLAQVYTPLITSEAKTETTEQPTDYWSKKLRPDGLRRSRFTGSREKVSFVANNARRVERDSPQTEFQKVSWEIERNESGAYTLFRSTDWDVYQYEDRGGRTKPQRVALLENLTSAKFSYYRKSNKTWEDTWDSEGAYAKPDQRYPDLVSLKIELPDPTNNANNQSWEIKIKPNLTLNFEDEAKKEQKKTQALD